jgi:hypothetical protein
MRHGCGHWVADFGIVLLTWQCKQWKMEALLVDGDEQLVQQALAAAGAAGGDEHVQAAHMEAHIGAQVRLQARLAPGRRQRRDGRRGRRVAGVVHQRQPVRHERLRALRVQAVERTQRPRRQHLLLLLRHLLQLHLQRLDVLDDLPHHRALVRLHPQPQSQ